MFVVCGKHIDRAIDQFVDEFEDAPDIYMLNEIRFTAWEAPEQCDFCPESPSYLVI